MRDLFDKYIDWDAIAPGEVDVEKYKLEIISTTFNRKTETLNINVSLNFVVPYVNELELKAVILNTVPQVKDVDIQYEYKDLIISEERAIKLFVPRMVRMANGEFRTITENIDEESGVLEGDTIYINASEGIDVIKKYVTDFYNNHFGE